MSIYDDLMKRFERGKDGKLKFRMFAGAKGGRLTNDWGAGGTSQDSELFTSLAALRNRSRQMIRDNPHAANLQRIVIDNVVGTGIGLQAQVTKRDGSPDQPVNDQIEEAWQRWCEKDTCHTAGQLGMTELLRMAIGGVFQDGEAIIRKVRRPFGQGRIPFALEVIEPDLLLDHGVGTYMGQNGNTIRFGVEVDQWQRPVAYWMRRFHPGDFAYAGEIHREAMRRIPAKDIEHLHLVSRWPQTRGVPWMHMVIRRLRDMGGYTESELTAARAAANIMGFVQQSLDTVDPGDFEKLKKVDRFIKSEPGTFQRLLPGETFNGFAPSRPNAQLDGFMRYMLREVASGVGVSYESLSRDYSQSNYSSSRLALLDDRNQWRVLQSWLIRNYLNDIYREWLDAAVISGAVRIPDYFNRKEHYQKVRFKPRGWSWVDPQKEVQAYVLAVQHGFMSRSDVIAAIGNGQDREDVDKMIKSDRERAKALGLDFDTETIKEQSTGNSETEAGE